MLPLPHPLAKKSGIWGNRVPGEHVSDVWYHLAIFVSNDKAVDDHEDQPHNKKTFGQTTTKNLNHGDPREVNQMED